MVCANLGLAKNIDASLLYRSPMHPGLDFVGKPRLMTQFIPLPHTVSESSRLQIRDPQNRMLRSSRKGYAYHHCLQVIRAKASNNSRHCLLTEQLPLQSLYVRLRESPISTGLAKMLVIEPRFYYLTRGYQCHTNETRSASVGHQLDYGRLYPARQII